MMELHLYDFDGTLFRSPMPPDWWKRVVRKTWWIHPDSLNRPCVPDNPDASWWVNSTVAEAKKSISDPDVITILCTGRPDKVANFRYRIPELLAQRGLRFDGVYLNNTGAEGVATFKLNVIGEYLRKYPEIEVVQVWEDRSHHLSSFESFVNQKGKRCVTHLVHETPKEPMCNEQTYQEADPYAIDPSARRVAARWMYPKQAVELDPKMQILLLKIRKDATASISLKKMMAVLDFLGGWKVEKVVGLVPLHFTKEDTNVPASIRDTGTTSHGPDEATIKAQYAKLKALEVSSLPASPKKGMVYVMDMGPITKVRGSYDPWQFDYKVWVGAEGYKFTSPSGKTEVFLPGRFDFERGGKASEGDLNVEPMWTPEYKVFPWLSKETELKAQVNQALGLEEHVPATQRTRENTGTCPACFGNFKMKPGKKLPYIVLHGYTRPGWGYIQGKCFGVGFPPFELSPMGTEKLKVYLEGQKEKTEVSLAELKSGKRETIALRDKIYKKDDINWERVLQDAIRHTENLVKHIQHDIELLTKLLREWKVRPLPEEGKSISVWK